MVNTQKLVIGYISIFLSIYLFAFFISMIINVKSDSTNDLIGTKEMTNAYTASASLNTVYSGFGLIALAIIVLVSFGLITTFSAFS